MPKVRCEKCGKTFESGNDGFLAKTFSSTKIAAECEECQERHRDRERKESAVKTLEIAINGLCMAAEHDAKMKSLESEQEIKKESIANQRYLGELKIKEIGEMHKHKVDAAQSTEKERFELIKLAEQYRSAVASTVPQEKKVPGELKKLFLDDSVYKSSDSYYEVLNKVPHHDQALPGNNDAESN